MQGLLRVIRQGDLTALADRTELSENIRRESSTVYAFACDELGLGTDNATDITFVKTADLYSLYKTYCHTEGIRSPEKHNTFTQKLGKIYNMKSKNMRLEGEQGRRFVPIG